MGHGPMIATAIGMAVVTVIIVIVVVAGGFRAVDEDESCLVYDVHTRAIDDEIISTAGTAYYGITKDLLCFPKRVLHMEFSTGSEATGDVLTARTKDGLEVLLHISIEYQLKKEELRELFFEVTLDFAALFQRIARSSLRNTASSFSALQYLGRNRSQISDKMRDELDIDLGVRHGQALEVLLNAISLPSQFNRAITEVEAQQIDAKKAVEEAAVARATERSKNETEVLRALAEREALTIAARAQLQKTTLERDALLIAEGITANQQRVVANTTRANTILAAEANVTRAAAAQEGAIVAAETEKNKQIIKFETEVLEATAAAEVTVINANATAQRIRERGVAAVTVRLSELSVLTDDLSRLVNDLGMTSDQVLQYLYLQALDRHRSAPLFVDYQKKSLMAETQRASFF